MRAVDFIDEFIGKNIERFVSFYNYIERQDCLGPERDDSIKIETSEFKAVFLRILEGADLTERNIFLAIYGAYHIALGRNIDETKVIFHHSHNIAEAAEHKKYFPDARLIISTRDPRTAYVSAIGAADAATGATVNADHASNSSTSLNMGFGHIQS